MQSKAVLIIAAIAPEYTAEKHQDKTGKRSSSAALFACLPCQSIL
jgi:hypothetical protein